MKVRGYWSTLGIIIGAFFLIVGFMGWVLGIEFSNTIRHSITVPYALLALVVSPILIVGGVILFFLSLIIRRREKPAPPPPVVPKELEEHRKRRSREGQSSERLDSPDEDA
jgi:hypothetical protein